MHNQQNNITSPMLEQAFALLEKGWSVIPVGTDKKPLIEWKKYQTQQATRDEVTSWFSQFPNANLAVITGKISNIVVVDIDPRHGGRRGAFIGYETVVVETGGDGWHYYFQYQDGISNYAGIEEGIDIRGEGGYVIVPPSSHSSGKQYKWYRSPDKYEVQPLLKVVLGWIEKKSKEKQSTQSNWSADKLDGVGEGQRNDTAASVAGKLLARFKPDEWESEAWKLLVSWNNDKNKPPLLEPELRSIFDSIASRERSKTTNEPELPALASSDSSLEQVFQQVEAVLPGKRDLVLLAMAVSISHFIDQKTPLWLMLVGVPSSAKTEVARMIGRAEWIFFLDAITENGFVSGGRGDTNDLLPKLDKRTLVIKDFTTTLSQREEMVKKLIGDLTSIYDDSFVKHSPSRGTLSYTAFFSLFACVTPQALNRHQRYMNQIGPRFLFYRVPNSSTQQIELSFSVLWSPKGLKEESLKAQEAVSAYITGIKEKILDSNLEEETVETKKFLNSLALFVANARGTVLTRKAEFMNKNNELIEFYEPVEIQREEPFRAMLQLRVLTRSLTIVSGKREITQAELKLVKQVALSTMPADRSLLLSVIVSEARAWTANEISGKLGISHKTAIRQLDELVSLGIVTKTEQGQGQANKYLIKEEFQNLVYENPESLSNENKEVTETQTPQRVEENVIRLKLLDDVPDKQESEVSL